MSTDSNASKDNILGVIPSAKDVEELYALTPPEKKDGLIKKLGATFDYVQAQNEKLADAAYHDPQTGLYSDRYWREAIEQAAQKNHTVLIQVNVDLDRLKTINDVFLHSSGDLQINKVSNLLKECFRMEDTIARVGGDEFSALIEIPEEQFDSSYEEYKQKYLSSNPKAPLPTKAEYWEKLISSKLNDTIVALDNYSDGLPFSVSYGIAISTPSHDKNSHHNMDDLQNQADKAMYAMKSKHHEEMSHYFQT